VNENELSGEAAEVDKDQPEEVDLWKQPRLVLVVDDDPDLRAYVRDILERAEYRVKTAADGKSALHSLANEVPDAVLLDIRMPGMSGDEVLDLLNRIQGHPPVIIMTAAQRARSRALAHHNPYYLAKPFDETVLLATLETAIEEGPRRAEAEVDEAEGEEEG
jgi:CheY-like chemotaxis protein